MFEAYLQNHTQSVSFTDVSGNRQISTALPNNMGVFQGSALGPLLYTIFSNDLSLFVPGATVVQYADDTQVLVCGNKTDLTDLTERMEQALSSLDLWFRANSLKVNPDKTQLIVFGSRQNLRNMTPLGVKFRERTIKPVSEVKNLGVTFDRHLSCRTPMYKKFRKNVLVSSLACLTFGTTFRLRSSLPSWPPWCCLAFATASLFTVTAPVRISPRFRR